MPPPNRKITRPLQALAAGIVILLLATNLLLPQVIRYGYGNKRAACQFNLKQLGQAFQLYLQDYGETYPPVKAGSGKGRRTGKLGPSAGWANAISIYVNDPTVFYCPSVNVPIVSGQVDYGYNAITAGASEDTFNNSSNTVLQFEGNRMAGTALTASLSNTSRVRTNRHLDGSNYSFIDGHVKWLQSTRYPSTYPVDTGFTFMS